MLDKCVCCGAEVPEGRQICPCCQRRYESKPERIPGKPLMSPSPSTEQFRGIKKKPGKRNANE